MTETETPTETEAAAEPAPKPAPLTQAQQMLGDDPSETFPALHYRLASLLKQGVEAKDFESQLSLIEFGLGKMLEKHPDDSLFVLVQLLSKRTLGYSASHALLCALTCNIVGSQTEMSPQELKSLTRAALTMNMSMIRLQDKLAKQPHPADETEREQIKNHPTESARMLREIGIKDDRWLNLVEDHHETFDGTGYPKGKSNLDEAQQLLHISDLFAAHISSRVNRRGLSSNKAVGNIFLKAQEYSSRIGTQFVKSVGMYPPGTYIRLKNDEIAVVVRRGSTINKPVAMAISDEIGMPMLRPKRRDTQIPHYQVRHYMPPEDIKIQFDMGRLLKRA